MRVEALQPLTGGINRLRNKGGADPRQLYDLLNGFVDQDGSAVSRPGVVKVYDLPTGTRGLAAANGVLNVFSDSPKEGVPDGVECIVLRHPTIDGLTLHDIHFAGPFLGDENGALLYVVVEFNNADVYHYWTRTADEWAADTAYQPGDLVQPSTPNGFLYRARRSGTPYPAWASGVNRSVGDIVEPPTSNGYYYEVIDVAADPTASGTTEPTWPAADGGVITEYTVATTSSTSAPTDTGSGALPDPIFDRYKCVVWDSTLDDGALAVDAQVGDLHDCWTPEEGFTRQPLRFVGEPVMQPCVRVTLSDGSTLRCSVSTPFTDPAAATDTQDWRAPGMLGHAAFNGDRVALEVVAVEDIGPQWVVPLDFGGRSFPAGDVGLVYSHNAQKAPGDPSFEPESPG